MKLLVDANISWRIKKLLGPEFEVTHVDNSPLNVPASDNEIWHYARVNDMIIVTNDDDFLNLSLLRGFPPKIILLRLGNQKTQTIADAILHHKATIMSMSTSDEIGILELFG